MAYLENTEASRGAAEMLVWALGWEAQINKLNGDPHQAELIEKVRRDIIPQLDANYPYYDDFVCATGEGLHAEIDDETERPTGRILHAEARISAGVHKGFDLVRLPSDEDQVRITHLIQVGEYEESTECFHHVFRLFSQFVVGNCVVLSLTELDGEITGITSDNAKDNDVPKKLLQLTGINSLIVQAAGSDYWKRLPDCLKIGHLSALYNYAGSIREVEGSVLAIQARRFLMNIPNTIDTIALDPEEETISGICYGISSREALFASAGLGIVEGCRDEDGPVGLSLIIQPDYSTGEKLGIPEDNVIFVPLEDQEHIIVED